METDQAKEDDKPQLRFSRRTVAHYNCGCTTTQIEAAREDHEAWPVCNAHGGRLLKQVETVEVRSPQI
jgi:hypothetical protein